MLAIIELDQKEEIMQLIESMSSNFHIVKEKNDRIYHQMEFEADKLPSISEEIKMIHPLEPKDIKSKLEDEKLFEQFLSEKDPILEKELLDFARLNIVEIEESIQKYIVEKEHIDLRIDNLIKITNQIQEKKDNDFRKSYKKFDKFVNNGGLQSYQDKIQKIHDSSKICSEVINTIKSSMRKEKEEDSYYQSLYKSAWKSTSSNDSNLKFTSQLKNLEEKYNVAQAADKNTFERYEKLAEKMINLSGPTAPSNEKNRLFIGDLMKIKQQISDIFNIREAKESLYKIIDQFFNSDYFKQALASINSRKVSKEEEVKKLTNQIAKGYEPLKLMLKEGFELLYNISNKLEEDEKIVKENCVFSTTNDFYIDEINQLYKDIQLGITFYSNLMIYLDDLNTSVEDYCLKCKKENDLQIQELINFKH